jgi:hypothetical protein
MHAVLLEGPTTSCGVAQNTQGDRQLNPAVLAGLDEALSQANGARSQDRSKRATVHQL